MNTITINAADAVSIASLFNTLARDQVTPVLTEIQLTISDGKLSAYATDRFCLASYECDADGPDGELRLTTPLAKWIVTNVKPKNKHYAPAPVVIDYDPDTREVSVRHDLATMAGAWTNAKYPGVSQLLETWDADPDAKPVTLNANFLTRLNKFLRDFKKVELWVIETGKAANGNAERPGPVRAKSGPFTFLIQPNLIRQPE